MTNCLSFVQRLIIHPYSLTIWVGINSFSLLLSDWCLTTHKESRVSSLRRLFDQFCSPSLLRKFSYSEHYCETDKVYHTSLVTGIAAVGAFYQFQSTIDQHPHDYTNPPLMHATMHKPTIPHNYVQTHH